MAYLIRHIVCDSADYRAGRVDDPLSIGIAIITAAEAISGIAIGFTAASTIGTLAIGAAITGAQFALQKLTTPKPGSVSAAATINAPEVRGNIRQSSPPWRIIYGSPGGIGGAVFFLDDTKPPYLYLGLLHSERPIARIRGVRLGDNNLSLPALANNTVLTPLAVEGQNYIKSGVSRLRFCFRDGAPDQPIDALIHADFPSLESSFRQRGIPTSTWRFEYGDDANDFEKTWGQVSIPEPYLDVDGAPVYDPRDPLQRYPTDWRDTAEVAECMATWTFTDTAALVQADHLGWPDGLGHRPDQLRFDEIGRSADYDEQTVFDKDGTARKRHAIAGVISAEQSPVTVAEAMATANRGFIVQSRGRGWVSSSQPREPVLTLTDDMVIGTYEFRGLDRPNSDLVNRVGSRFPSSERDNQEIDGPVLDRPDLQAEDGELLPRQLRFPFTPRHQAVQRLEDEYLKVSRLPRSWAGVVKLQRNAFRLDIGDCVAWQSELIPEMNGRYTVDDGGFLDDFSGFRLALNERDDTIAATYNAAIDERTFTLPDLTVS